MTQPDFIPFHRPSIGTAEREAVLEVLDSGWLTTGARTVAFEEAFARFVDMPYAVAVNSATAALHLAFEGLGVGDGDEVIVPTYTFAASAETVLYLRATPVLVDVDPITGNIDPGATEAAITPRTKAIEVVHVGGLPADMRSIAAAVDRASGRLGIAPPPIVEDTAHAFPSPIAALNGRMAGTVGHAGAFSFYATKTITTGEGGMLVTADERLADRARQMRLHGISRDAWKRYTAAGSWYYEIEEAGFKDNLTDIAAAIGLVQLERSADLRRERANIAEQYLAAFGQLAAQGQLVLPERGQGDEHAWHLFVVRLPNGTGGSVDESLAGVSGLPAELRALGSRRAAVLERLRDAGVGASVHFIPLHLHPLYARMGYRPGQLPAAERAYAGAISLPIWPGMTSNQVERVVAAVCEAIG
jgi:dTDP-4-amino-4,6-dideoxygalactose transaminase